MRIGIVLSAVPGYSETFFRSKISGLMRHGHSVYLIVQKEDKSFKMCPVVVAPKIYRNGFVLGFSWLGEMFGLLPYWKRVYTFWQLERELGKSMTEVIKAVYLNAHILKLNLDWLHFGFATMALGRENLAESIHAKMAVSFRGFDIAIYPLKNPNCYDRLWKKVDKVHTISDDLLSRAYELGLGQSVPYQKITPAIDVNFFDSSVKRDGSFRKPLRLLTVGRMHWKKGYTYMLEALAGLKERGIPFVYTIIGTGSIKERERVKYAAFQLGLSSQVRFLGAIPPEEVKKEYGQNDIYLQYSVSEGFCNAVLEAQSMGLLCIVSDAEGLPENVKHETSGWVVPKLQPQLLLDRILKTIELGNDERARVSNNALVRVRDSFSIEKQSSEFLEFYGSNGEK